MMNFSQRIEFPQKMNSVFTPQECPLSARENIMRYLIAPEIAMGSVSRVQYTSRSLLVGRSVILTFSPSALKFLAAVFTMLLLPRHLSC